MTDREQVIALLENADIEYEEWNERLITADNGNVEFHFDADGKLSEVVGAAW